jgi:hypothetical protein
MAKTNTGATRTNRKAIRRPEARRYKGYTVLGRDDSIHGEIQERSFVAKGAPPSCAKKDVGYGGQAG